MFGRLKHDERKFLEAYHERGARDAHNLRVLQRLAGTLPHSPSGSVFLGVVSRLGSATTSGAVGGGDTSGRQYWEHVIHHLVQQQIVRQEAYLPFLATTGTITPFIGLLGTVVGVINAFREIGVAGTASIAAVAPGISEALLATAAGLFAAIPAVVGYNTYLAGVRTTTFGVEAFGVECLHVLDGLASASASAGGRAGTSPGASAGGRADTSAGARAHSYDDR